MCSLGNSNVIASDFSCSPLPLRRSASTGGFSIILLPGVAGFPSACNVVLAAASSFSLPFGLSSTLFGLGLGPCHNECIACNLLLHAALWRSVNLFLGDWVCACNRERIDRLLLFRSRHLLAIIVMSLGCLLFGVGGVGGGSRVHALTHSHMCTRMRARAHTHARTHARTVLSFQTLHGHLYEESLTILVHTCFQSFTRLI